MPLPTPQDAASARNNAGFFNNLGSGLLTKSPYVGPLYNLGSTIAHLIQGTTGQYGPATTPFGRLLSAFSGNPTNAPRAIPVDSSDPGYYSQGTGFTPAGNPQPQQGQTVPPGQQPTDALGAGGIPQNIWAQVYNSGRFTNAPAFSPTLSQALFPGSRIGPGGSSVGNPYTGATGPDAPPDNSIPPGASSIWSYIMSRNQP